LSNTLVVYTPRSGSTILNDLLAFKYNNLNLDEMTFSVVRGKFLDRLPPDIREKAITLNREYVHNETTGQPPSVHIDDYNRRVEYVKSLTDKGVSVKEWANGKYPCHKYIEWCIDNNYEIYFLYRRNFEAQVYSLVCSSLRNSIYSKQMKGKITKYDSVSHAYVQFKDDEQIKLRPCYINKERIIDCVNTVMHNIYAWTSYHLLYSKYGKTLQFEDSIERHDFSQAGISPEMYYKYNSSPHPVVEFEKNPIGKYIGNWHEAKDYIKLYESYVEKYLNNIA